jgi:hypothetical protein
MIRKIIQLTGGCEQVASNKSKHADLVKLSPFLYQKKPPTSPSQCLRR